MCMGGVWVQNIWPPGVSSCAVGGGAGFFFVKNRGFLGVSNGVFVAKQGKITYFALFSSKMAHFALFCLLETPQNTTIFYEKMPAPPSAAREGAGKPIFFCTHTPPIQMGTGAGRPSLLSPVWPACSRAPPPTFVTVPYGSVTKGGVSSPPGLCVYRRREEVYHYTHVCGGCVGTTYMGSPVWTRTQCAFAAFFPEKSCF